MKKLLADLTAFHVACDVPVLTTPQFPDESRIKLRSDLLLEEVDEYHDAVTARDLPKVADALGDIIYIAVGSALEFGIPLDRVWAAIHGSNMAKVDAATGKVRKREDGKVLKPEGWTPPDIEAALAPAPEPDFHCEGCGKPILPGDKYTTTLDECHLCEEDAPSFQDAVDQWNNSDNGTYSDDEKETAQACRRALRAHVAAGGSASDKPLFVME